MRDEVNSIVWLHFWKHALTLFFLACVISVGEPDLIDAVIHWIMK